MVSSVFGEIPGVPVGSAFASRLEVKAAGLHRHQENGISGNSSDLGADAIVVAQMYKDDVDDGDVIVYTGEGGRGQGGDRQTENQTLTKGNLALARSEEHGLPVRVIRKATTRSDYAPASGYRYDGLYVVTKHWQEPSIDGPLIWRFELVRQGEEDGWAEAAAAGARPVGNPHPGRTPGVVQRIVRSTQVTEWVKQLHKGRCQFCGVVLETPVGWYAEGAHVRALGTPHNGPDSVDNVLCLCPNDHVLFDKGALCVDGGKVIRTVDGAVVGGLQVAPGHAIDPANFAYHREHFAGGR